MSGVKQNPDPKPNELIERAGKSPWAILGEQFTGIMVVMLIISAVVSVILGETIDAVVIMVIVVLNAILGFVQEYHAEQAMAAGARGYVIKDNAKGIIEGIYQVIRGEIYISEELRTSK